MNFDVKTEAEILNLNRLAMKMLKDQLFSDALEHLKKASTLVDSIQSQDQKLKLQGITLNNFGCFYKRTKKPNVALKYLTQACENEKLAEVDCVNMAATYLNICAIYSELGKHDLALKEGLRSLELMIDKKNYTPNFISTLAIAYHNTAVEYEYLSCYKEASENFRLAWETVHMHLGDSHPLAISMLADFKSAERKLQEKEMRATIKENFRKEHVPKVTKTRFKSAKRPSSKKAEVYDKVKKPQVVKKLKKPVTFKYFPSVSKNSEEKQGLNRMRFLTGERLQPMFPGDGRMRSLPRGTIREKEESKGSDKEKEGLTPKYFHNRAISMPDKTAINRKQKLLQNVYKRVKEIDQIIDDLHPAVLPEPIANPKSDQKLENAAVLIQKTYRGHAARKQAKILNQVSKKPANPLIKNYENLVIVPEHEKNRLKSNDFTFPSELEVIPEMPDLQTPLISRTRPSPLSCTKACFKGFLTRKEFNKHSDAAIIIQKHIRRFLCFVIYKSIKEAIVCIQSNYRGYLARRNLKNNNNGL